MDPIQYKTTADTDLQQPAGTRTHKNYLRAFIVTFVLLIVTVGALAYTTIKQSQPVIQPSKANQTEGPVVVKSGNQFLEKPEKLTTDLKIFKNYDAFGADCINTDCTEKKPFFGDKDIAYYRIGKTADNHAIYIAATPRTFIDSSEFVLVETRTGVYSLIAQENSGLFRDITAGGNDDISYVKTLAASLSDTVTIDKITRLAGLEFTADISYKKAVASISSYSTNAEEPNGYLMPNGLVDIRGATYPATAAKNVSLLKKTDSNRLYAVLAQDQLNFQVKELYATNKNFYAARYKPKDTLTSEYGIIKIAPVWKSGETSVNAPYTNRPVGCGSADGFLVAKNIKREDLDIIGIGPSRQNLYRLPTSSALFQEIYSTDYNNGENLQENSLKNLSAQDFNNKHGVFLAENGLGDLGIYLRGDMIIGGGCGKPVIYLYPTKKTLVNIAVGATVTKSEPLYPSNGWRSVSAKPNGELTYRGKAYSSLFWEGLGNGIYPAITAGIVVERNQAPLVIRQQLHEQGLNQTEINDFMIFWEPRLPDSPYVRLSWLKKAEIDTLAPLRVQPVPNTNIRVFLDFAGQSNPATKLVKQQFNAPERRGFTMVEWGGLLHE